MSMEYRELPAVCAPSLLEVKLTFRGKVASVRNVSRAVTVGELERLSRETFRINDAVDKDGRGSKLKLLHRGKLLNSADPETAAFSNATKGNSVKVMVMSTSSRDVSNLNEKRSDPTVRGFGNEVEMKNKSIEKESYLWGPNISQNKNYKFCRFEACTWQSFGHRPTSATPHAFRAMQLLEKLATDPGVISIMIERELVVGTLGEMDPIDDRLMQKKQAQGSCLLGYNTNAGARIDIKLRTDDLRDFRPYPELVGTLIHELSHNWVGEHSALFWTNFGQMRLEYLHKHASLAASGYVVHGKTSAELAGVAHLCRGGLKSIKEVVIAELSREVAQHGVPLQLIIPAIDHRGEEFKIDGHGLERGQKLGGEKANGARDQRQSSTEGRNARDLALAAAERRRAREQNEERHRGSSS